MSPNFDKADLALAPLSGEVSDGRLSELLAQGYRLDTAILTVLHERYEKKLEREFFKDQCFIPGANLELDVIDIE
jgi:hypothetical protein